MVVALSAGGRAAGLVWEVVAGAGLLPVSASSWVMVPGVLAVMVMCPELFGQPLNG
jgi:hypothetical protein